MAEKHVFIQKDKDDIGNAHLKSLFHLYMCLCMYIVYIVHKIFKHLLLFLGVIVHLREREIVLLMMLSLVSNTFRFNSAPF